MVHDHAQKNSSCSHKSGRGRDRDLASKGVLTLTPSPISRGGVSKQIFEAELDQPRRHRSLRDDAEACRPKIRARIGELRVVEGIVELRAKSKLCVFPDAAHRGRLADGEIRIELARPVKDALPGISVT